MKTNYDENYKTKMKLVFQQARINIWVSEVKIHGWQLKEFSNSGVGHNAFNLSIQKSKGDETPFPNSTEFNNKNVCIALIIANREEAKNFTEYEDCLKQINEEKKKPEWQEECRHSPNGRQVLYKNRLGKIVKTAKNIWFIKFNDTPPNPEMGGFDIATTSRNFDEVKFI